MVLCLTSVKQGLRQRWSITTLRLDIALSGTYLNLDDTQGNKGIDAKLEHVEVYAVVTILCSRTYLAYRDKRWISNSDER